jgi:hypothetical protein
MRDDRHEGVKMSERRFIHGNSSLARAGLDGLSYR